MGVDSGHNPPPFKIMKKLFRLLPIIIALVIPLALVMVRPVLAQGPDEPLADWTVHRWSELLDLDQGPSQGALCSTGDPLIGYAYTPGDYFLSSAAINRASDCAFLLGAFEAVSPQLDVGSSAAIQFTIAGDSGQGNGYNAQWHVYTYDGLAWSSPTGNYGQGPHTVSIPEGTEQIAITYWSPFFYIGPTPYITGFQYININPTNLTQECDTIEDADFTGLITDTWLTSNGAVITDSVLTLPVSGIAAQNLSLSSLTTYNAVISTTTPVSETELTIRLGTSSQTLEITGTGLFTASFTTPNLSGPIAYIIENTGENTTTLDFTCLYPSYTNGVTSGCLAPVNGEFITADHWAFERGAQWDSPSQKAALPYTDVALSYSTTPFSIPTVITGQYVILSFTSHKMGVYTSAVMGRVRSGGSSVNWTFETYETDYTYEVSLNTLSGMTDTNVAFVNPGLTGSLEISSTEDIVVDDVCIFVANRPPNMPTPEDPNQIPNVNLGFNFTSCDDVDGILAYFGVNMQQYRAEYEAGASIWDPIGWVPWLISAMWVILATYLCIFMAAFTTFMAALEYILTNILNYFSWFVRSGINLRLWALSLFVWLLATLLNVGSWWNTSLNLIMAWFALSGGNVFVFLAFLIDFIITGLFDWLSFLVSSWPENLLPRLWNIFIGILNILIVAWNLLLTSINTVINAGFAFIVGIWNSLVPLLNDLWGWISGQISTVYEFGLTIFNMLVGLVELLWAYVVNGVMIPIEFYNGFSSGVSSEAFAFLATCVDGNFWCQLLAGLQIINQTVGQSVMYPIVIVGIIVVTGMLLWRNFFKIFTVEIQ